MKKFKYAKTILIFLVFVVCFVNLIQAQQKEIEKKEEKKVETKKEIVIIVNEKSPLFEVLKKEKKSSLTEKDLMDIYTGKTKYWQKTKILVINQKEKEIFETFLERYIKMTSNNYKNYWVKKVFAEGGSGPEVKEKTEDTIKYVGEKEGAIGYVYEEDLTGEEKGLKKIIIIKKK